MTVAPIFGLNEADLLAEDGFDDSSDLIDEEDDDTI
jgi:hypothetical protein